MTTDDTVTIIIHTNKRVRFKLDKQENGWTLLPRNTLHIYDGKKPHAVVGTLVITNEVGLDASYTYFLNPDKDEEQAALTISEQAELEKLLDMRDELTKDGAARLIELLKAKAEGRNSDA